jgi:hypothetical protein
VASHEVGRSTECCERRSCRRIGLPAPTMTSLLSREPMWCDSTAVPRSLASPGSSSHELFLSYRVSTIPSLPCALPCKAPLLGFPSPSRYQHAESTNERGSHVSPYRSALGVSHALGGLLLRAPCRFVSPHNHVRDSPSRGYLPLPSRIASSATRTLLPFAGSSLPPSCPDGARPSRPVCRVLIRAAIRSHRKGD